MNDAKKSHKLAGDMLDQWCVQESVHRERMSALYTLAQSAGKKGEVPVAASLWKGNTCVARDHNRVEEYQDPMMHAEYSVVRQFIAENPGQYLEDYILYVTLLPCTMCQGFLGRMRLGALCYGAVDEQQKHTLSLSCMTWGGVLKEECSLLLKDFFKDKRL